MTDQNPTTPPWGDNFDAERAWTLVQNLRAELTTEKDKTKTERQAREAAERSLQEADPEGKITEAETRAKAAERELYVERALRKHEIDEDLVEFLSGDTEEEILTKAERLSKLGKPKDDKGKDGDKDKDGQGETPKVDATGRPVPNLVPGHGGDESAPFDADAIVKSVRSAQTY
jgi:hypothetical protein